MPTPTMPLPPGIISARIQRLILNDSVGTNRVGNFVYDFNGRPLRMNFLENPTGFPSYEFQYDKYGRLSASIGLYNNGSYESWRRYFYDNLSRIYLEVFNVFGDFSESPDPTGHGGGFTEFKYDAQNRIIQTISHADTGGTPTPRAYTYNASGNLVEPGALYDTNTNYRRTNAIWMFLDRDYSLNNRLGATSYNAAGLPLGFHAVVPSQPVFFVTKQLINAQIFY